MDKIQILKKIEEFLQTQPDHSFKFNEGTTLDLIFWGNCTKTFLYGLYITDSPRRADEKLIITSRPTWDIENICDVDCVEHFSLMECQQILDTIVKQVAEKEYKTIHDMLRENDADFDEIYQSEEQVEITVTWGDWKHSHGHLDHLMEKIGYSLIDERITETDNSDSYSSVHIYRKN
jgi:hypothetical protein